MPSVKCFFIGMAALLAVASALGLWVALWFFVAKWVNSKASDGIAGTVFAVGVMSPIFIAMCCLIGEQLCS